MIRALFWFKVTAGKYAPICTPGSSTATTLTTTIGTTTIDPAMLEIQQKLDELREKLGAADTPTKNEIEDLGDALLSTTQYISEVFDRQNKLEARLDAQDKVLRALAARPARAPQNGVGCEPGSPECAPAITATSSGDLVITAKDGSLKFETGECAETDLCELVRDFKAVIDRLKS